MAKEVGKNMIRYPQPYSIKIETGNPMQDYHLKMKEHCRLKYEAKY